ncbi:MAG: hypothetical protein N2484_04415 [Clostridia bacterium]|nr:hypothetical protein [Clostridia bacterium]
MNAMFGAFFAVPFFILWISAIILGIYSLILFIKLAQRGIKALDIYIAKNQNSGSIE